MFNHYDYQNLYQTTSLYGQSESEINQLIKKLENTLPAVFSRQEVSKQLRNLISAKTFSNLDAKHQGSPKFQVGGKVAYEKESFLVWLRNRMEN